MRRAVWTLKLLEETFFRMSTLLRVDRRFICKKIGRYHVSVELSEKGRMLWRVTDREQFMSTLVARKNLAGFVLTQIEEI